MRNFLSISLLSILLSIAVSGSSQCSGAPSFTLSPAPVNGSYEPGTIVSLCYTMDGWNGTAFGSNWLEGFGISLGPGWVSYTPLQEPVNCSNNGSWLWLESVSSASSGLTAGPGYFYEGPQGPVDGNSGNDWGDFGTTCQWTFCVQLQVTDACDPLSLYIGVTPYADGSMGSWTNESCFDPAFQVFNGTVAGGNVSTSAISVPMDTVCVGLNQSYSVLNTPGSTYDWEISGGGSFTESGTNSILVDWGGIPGDYIISVQETTIEGCLGDLVTAQVVVSDTVITFNQPRTGICLGDTTKLIALPSGGYWSGQNLVGDIFTGYTPGYYRPQYTVNIHGCVVTDSVEVFVRDLFAAPVITTTLTDLDLCIHNNSQSYLSEDDPSIEYTWHVDGHLQTDTDYELNLSWQDSTTSHTITVYGTDTIGCKSERGFINVNVKACHRVYVPNSFTPNGDGFNDAFKISGLSIYEPRLKIYNRYGSIIYEIKSISDSWNGNDGNGYYCPNGVYNWIMTYKDDSGFGQVETGHVVLIR